MSRIFGAWFSNRRVSTGLARLNKSSGRHLRRKLWLHSLEERTTPTVFTVSNTGDSGAGSLRQAITDANADANPDADTINATGISGTISLLSALPAISDATVSLQGPGSGSLTVTATGTFRLFSTTGTGALHNVSISGMKLTNGNQQGLTGTLDNGGGIFVLGANLTLTDVQIIGCKTDRAGGGIGVDNAGNGTPKTVTLNNCLISGCTATGTTSEATFVKGMGGALYFGDSGILNLNNSTVTGNSAAKWGGAGYLFAAATSTWNITGSTISGNIANWSGGGFLMYGSGAQTMNCLNSLISGNIAKGTAPDYLYGVGGGLASAPSGGATNKLVVQNCTLTGNSALNGGAIALFYYGAGGKTITSIQNSTIVNNTASNQGGGIFAADKGAVVNIDSSIFKNSSTSGNDFNSLGTITINANVSLINDPAGAGAYNPDAFTSLKTGVDAMLGPLANNGGPTQSYLPQAGSPAIDNGSNPSFLSTDQRGPGFIRTYNSGLTDIGSIEIQPFGVPSATAGTLGNVFVPPGGTSYTFTVSYADDTAIKVSSLNTGDVKVTGPNGFSTNPSFVSVDVNSDGTPRVATYTFTPPGGTWNGTNIGKYVISMQANQVQDNLGNFVQIGTLGSFNVVAPTTFVVNATNDEVTDTDGKLSFREAVLAAQANAPASDTITFDPTVFASNTTIGLNGAVFGVMGLTDPLTINGPGATKVAIDGSGSAGIFGINAAIPVSINGVTLSGGAGAGGGAVAINIAGVTLNVNNCVFTNNSGSGNGGVIGQGAFGGNLAVINISNSTFKTNVASGWGGAIMLDADTSNSAANIITGNQLTISNCTFDGNVNSGNGGAIAIRLSKGGTLTIDNSTFNGNTATAFGGALSLLSSPGAGLVTVRNSTFFGNSANVSPNTGSMLTMGNGFDGTVNIQNCTITGGVSSAGGAIARSSGSGKVNLESTIVYGNNGGTGSPDFGGGDITAKNCIIFSSAGASSFADLGGNLFGVSADPLLGPLQNNGGSTLTCLPGSSSPAREAGSNPASLANDQRGSGFPRTLGAKTDIGAVESIDPIPIAKLNAADVLTGGATTYTFTVSYSDDVAINVASLGTGDVTVSGPNGFTATPTFVSVDINTNGTPRVATYTFNTPGGTWDTTDDGTYTISVVAGQVTDNSSNSVKAGPIGTFNVSVPLSLVVNATNDEATDTDGKTSLREAVLAANALVPSNDVITFDPTVFTPGAKITLTLGEIVISDSITINGLSPSKVTIDGGGASRAFNLNGPTTINVSISSVTISGCNSVSDGGAIFNGDEIENLTNVVFTGNSTGGKGGALLISTASASLTATDCTFTTNSAIGFGGALAVANNATINLVRSTFSGNTSAGGGAVYCYTGQTTVDSCTLSSNQSGGLGGAIMGTGVGKMTVRNSTIYGNTALQGGGISAGFFGNFTLKNSTVTNNVGTDGTTPAGGIFQNANSNPFPSMNIVSSIIVDNGTQDLVDNFAPLVYSNSAIGTMSGGAGKTDGGGNLALGQTGASLQLGPLANNGGTTQTQAIPTTSPAKNAGSNPDSLSFDQRGSGFNRVSGGQADIGAFEFQVAALPPTVLSVVINGANGAGSQRSMVESLVVTFSEAVNFTGAAFQLARTANAANNPGGLLGNVNLTVVETSPSATVTLKFAAGGTVGVDPAGTGKFSLLDGQYQLTIFSAGITGTGGNMAANFQTPTTGSSRIFRLYGDADGNGIVDGLDFGAFRTAFNTNSFTFDKDGSGVVDGLDFGQFRNEFNNSVP